MRHAVILAGGSGTRLWPMSRAALPKQLIPFLEGRSLLQTAADRLAPLFGPGCLHVCAADRYQAVIQAALPDLGDDSYLGEPVGRDTLNAVGLSTAVVARRDPTAVVAIFTADHVIQPDEAFRGLIAEGCALVERHPEVLLTFGVTPTAPSTGFGYLELGEPFDGALTVDQFREKPDLATAEAWLAAGPARYLWNSGMFIWRADTLLECIRRYEPEIHAGLMRIADVWDRPQRAAVLAEVYPTLRKISIDFAVMEPASRDPLVRVAALPMALDWLDVGSWPSFARTVVPDAAGNAVAAGRSLLLDTARTLVASNDPQHLIVTVGLTDLLVIHTPDATLICRADQAEAIKEVHRLVSEGWGEELV